MLWCLESETHHWAGKLSLLCFSLISNFPGLKRKATWIFMSRVALCQQWTTSPTNSWKQRSQTEDLTGISGPSGRDLVPLWCCGATYKSKTIDADDDIGMLIFIIVLICNVVTVTTLAVLCSHSTNKPFAATYCDSSVTCVLYCIQGYQQNCQNSVRGER